MDKIARIRQEIERLKKENDNIKCSSNKAYCQGYGDAFVDLLPFLDTLSEEPDKSLVEEISRTYHDGSVTDTEDIDHVAYENIAHHFAEWGAEHLRDTTKMIDKSLEEAAEEYRQGEVDTGCDYIDDSNGDSLYYSACLADAFIAGAEWQKEQDLAEMAQSRSPLSVAYANRCFENGKQAMKEQMLKDAVEACVNTYESISGGSAYVEFVADMPVARFRSNDKVRIVVLKEEEEHR